MDAAIVQAEKMGERLIKLKTESGVESINASRIMFSEAHAHYQYVTLHNGRQIRVRMTVTELYTTLMKCGGFTRVGSAYIINLRNVKNVSTSEAHFSNINSLSEAAAKRETERQNKLLLAQIEAETAQLTADSQARHDRRHHNLVMLEFANNNDIESVREYLRKLVDNESQVWGEKRYCDHMTVNTVLAVYCRRAEESGINVSISASVSRELDVLPQDLVIVIANLFENAINAVGKLTIDRKYIEISIKERAQRLFIKVENPCREKMVFDEFSYGIGIRSVIATTEKYDGMFDFDAENGVFSAKISLNLP